MSAPRARRALGDAHVPGCGVLARVGEVFPQPRFPLAVHEIAFGGNQRFAELSAIVGAVDLFETLWLEIRRCTGDAARVETRSVRKKDRAASLFERQSG